LGVPFARAPGPWFCEFTFYRLSSNRGLLTIGLEIFLEWKKHNNAATDNYENFERFVKPPPVPLTEVMGLIRQ
jgi:hypothetical protein